MVVAVWLSEVDFGTGALWAETRVWESLGESQMVSEAFEALGVVTFCPNEEWVGEGLKEEVLSEV